MRGKQSFLEKQTNFFVAVMHLSVISIRFMSDRC